VKLQPRGKLWIDGEGQVVPLPQTRNRWLDQVPANKYAVQLRWSIAASGRRIKGWIRQGIWSDLQLDLEAELEFTLAFLILHAHCIDTPGLRLRWCASNDAGG
jgi:hypothetical protein